MTVDANRVWSATLTLTGNGDATGAQRFKFDVFGNWSENYGDNEGDGIADKGSSKDILVSGAGSYRITLNESDLHYTVTPSPATRRRSPPSPKTLSVKAGESVVFDASASRDDGAW